jgi:alcohol dehydrogenase
MQSLLIYNGTDLSLERLWSHNATTSTRQVDTVSIPMLLQTVQSKRIDAMQLIAHRFKPADILDASEAFAKAAETPALEVMIEV